MEAEEEFKVSRDIMKVLSDDTRSRILKVLERRQMTASELSRYLDKHVTTVAEHLELLHQSNLVERIERPGRKWIYYRLSKIGKQMLRPQPYRIVLVLTLSLISLSFGLLSMPFDIRQNIISSFRQRAPSAVEHDIGSLPAEVTTPTLSTKILTATNLAFPILLIIISLVGVVYSIKKITKDYSSFGIPEK